MADPGLVDFGKYKGERWTRVNVGYLRWMVKQNPPHTQAPKAQTELDRRGTSVEDKRIVISAHAIDRFSLRRLSTWMGLRGEEEGIHAFLTRMVEEALDVSVDTHKSDRYKYNGMVLIIDTSMADPVLKTVM